MKQLWQHNSAIVQEELQQQFNLTNVDLVDLYMRKSAIILTDLQEAELKKKLVELGTSMKRKRDDQRTKLKGERD